ncbi:oxidoreductase [Sphaerisporangium melleum]|uniref:Oxidoreductase n=1 Tax=Sphaerisporangium melleum TaxID=321316 RepID=A0A917QTX6_9ACTN|nr:aldo/keto reductase [Sphaerisporangium melleum]GGK68541.1 oxidoreductase [Sphaerisporangium melleum]GII68900.1 oxidoreductase [Sphaerisporangium melleum]
MPANTITIGGDLRVGRLGYGAMQLTGKQVWGEYPDREGGIALLRHAVDAGVTFIDTADVYGPHTNEILIREALHPYPENLVIATKGGFVRGGHDYSTLGAVGNPAYLRQSAHLSARRLGVERIDLYYLHSGTATDAPFEEQVATLAALRDEGLIRHIGLSNVTLEQFHAARAITPIAAITARYNVSARAGEDLLRAAEQSGAVFSPWHPMRFDQGDDPEHLRGVMESIARRYEATPQQVALAWHLYHSPVTLPIPGTTTPAHLDQNLATAHIELSETDVATITALAQGA